jgi:hypothetical protein
MKTLNTILAFLWKIIGGLLAFIVEMISIIVLAIGTILWTLSLVIKSPKTSVQIFGELVKQLKPKKD